MHSMVLAVRYNIQRYNENKNELVKLMNIIYNAKCFYQNGIDDVSAHIYRTFPNTQCYVLILFHTVLLTEHFPTHDVTF